LLITPETAIGQNRDDLVRLGRVEVGYTRNSKLMEKKEKKKWVFPTHNAEG
jgi:hypothetical protein